MMDTEGQLKHELTNSDLVDHVFDICSLRCLAISRTLGKGDEYLTRCGVVDKDVITHGKRNCPLCANTPGSRCGVCRGPLPEWMV